MISFKTLVNNLLGVLAVLAFQVHAAGVVGQGTWETTLKARDINGEGVVDAYYDTTLDISWLANWNVLSVQTWASATAWAAALDVYGTSDWRLPATIDAGTSEGFKPPADSSELMHLFYVTLGNKGYPDSGWGLNNTASFIDMQAREYWTNTTFASNPFTAWYVDAGFGFQGHNDKGVGYFVVAVHPGDVAAVPEPGKAVLLVFGFAALTVARRLRSNSGMRTGVLDCKAI